MLRLIGVRNRITQLLNILAGRAPHPPHPPSFSSKNFSIEVQGVQLPRTNGKEIKYFALGSLNTLALQGTIQMYSVLLMTQHCWFHFRNRSLWFPKEIICLFPGKAQTFYSKDDLLPSSFSSSVTWLALVPTSGNNTSISSSQKAENKQKHFKENQNIKACTSHLFLSFSFLQRMNSSEFLRPSCLLRFSRRYIFLYI